MRICGRPALTLTLVSLTGALLSGCFDTKQDITLNPDGSGKAVIASSFARVDLLGDRVTSNGAQNVAEQSPSAFVTKLLEDSKGVDAWRDITFGELDDGRIHFRGTVYFRDLAKLKIAFSPFLQMAVTNDALGQLSIVVVPDKSEAPLPIHTADEPVTAESIRQERRQFRAAQPLLAATLGAMKCESTLQVSGVIRRNSNFELIAPQTLRLRVDGARLIRAWEEQLFDPAIARQRLAETNATNRLILADLLSEKIYGQKGPVLAVIAPGRKPLFDYAAEVAEARKSFPALAKELGLSVDPTDLTQPAVDGLPARVSVTGIDWRFRDRSRGYTLSLLAELPGSVLSVDEVRITRARTLEGALLNGSSSSRHFPSLEAMVYPTNFAFEARLSSPDLACKGIAELSGVLECRSAENLRAVELISGRIRIGENSVEFGTQIDGIGPVPTGGERLSLRTRLAPKQLLSLKVIDETGLAMHLERQGTMSVGQEHTYTYFTRRMIPRVGRLVGHVVSENRTVRIPFSVTNVTLLGQPLASR